MTDKSVQQDPFKIFNKNVAQECPASESDQSVKKAVSLKSVKKSVKQECRTRMSHKSVWCPTRVLKPGSIRVRGFYQVF